VAEELRFFVRIALYTIVTSAIYWFITYEWAGSMMLWALVVGGVFFAATVGAIVAAARRPAPTDLFNRTLGFVDHPDYERAGPLEIDPEPVPPSSAWPLLTAMAALLIGLGLVYGAWFWVPGGGLLVWAAWGWLTELER
jgi:Cytochrome c oxidase subunit IV